MAWGAASRRTFPWRETRDPWAVLVSEVMLQQTQTSRVVGPYQRFIARFPSPDSCAAAGRAEVVGAWSGLGYNRRAVRLHEASHCIVSRHGGAVPAEAEALEALPGVGSYTSRAVRALAFGEDVGVVDTNAARVLARAVAGRPLTATSAQELADALVPAGRGWELNQALFDLGATVCTSRRPRCDACPLRSSCAWRRQAGPSPDPAQGSFGASRPQPPFTGSDREGRGRLVEALRSGPLPLDEVACTMGWPGDRERAERVVAGLVAEGMVAADGGELTLA